MSAGTAEQPSPDARLNGPGPWVWIRVEDTGPGIATDRLAAIFEPFGQAEESTARQHGGSGLGMTISRRLARIMHGDLTVTSAVGYGSSFILWLPAVPDAVAPLPAPADA
jgi:signal transduction histidine kinase